MPESATLRVWYRCLMPPKRAYGSPRARYRVRVQVQGACICAEPRPTCGTERLTELAQPSAFIMERRTLLHGVMAIQTLGTTPSLVDVRQYGGSIGRPNSRWSHSIGPSTRTDPRSRGHAERVSATRAAAARIHPRVIRDRVTCMRFGTLLWTQVPYWTPKKGSK